MAEKRSITKIEAIGFALAVIGLALWFVPATQEWLAHRGVHVVIAWLILTVGASALEYLSDRSGKRIGTTTAVTGIVAGLLLLSVSRSEQRKTIPPPQPSEPFSVNVKSFYIQTKKCLCAPAFWIAFHSVEHGDVLSPVSLVLVFDIVNLQSVPSVIASLGAEIKIGSSEWLRLIHIDAKLGKMVWISKDDLAKVSGYDFTKNGLDYLLDSSIPAHETLRGVLFYEVPGDYSLRETEVVRYRIRLADTTGLKFETESAPAVMDTKAVRPSADLIQTLTLYHTGERLDLRRAAIGYFSEIHSSVEVVRKP